MSVSAVGATIYTNQASPLATQIHHNAQIRPEMMQFSLNQLVTEKEQEVEKVVESSDGHGIDPDRDTNDNSEMYKKEKKEAKGDSDEEESSEPIAIISEHHLDIKV